MRKLTVVQVVPAMQGGGVERGTLEVATALVQRGHRSIVISGGGRMVSALEATGSEHITWPVGKKSLLGLRLVPRLRHFLKQQHVDILHARSRMPAWIAYLAWHGMNKTQRPHFITTAHGQYSVNFYSSVMTRGERVIAVSNTIKDYLTNHYPHLDPHKIQVIYRGIDSNAFPYDYKAGNQWLHHWYEQYPQLLDSTIITLPGRLSRLKGHGDFIELMSRLKLQGANVYGVVVGDAGSEHGDYANEIMQLTQEKRLDNIIFTGYRNDVREIYTVSDMVLSLSSKPESFGRTVLEALSLGIPVIGYDHGGVSEVLNAVFPEGRVAVGDLDALTQKVQQFIAAKPAVTLMMRGTHPFPLKKMLDDTLDAYEAIAAGFPTAHGE